MKLHDGLSPRSPRRDPLLHPRDAAFAADQDARRALVAREQRVRDAAAGRGLDRGSDEGPEERADERRVVDDDDERAAPALDAERTDACDRRLARELRHERVEGRFVRTGARRDAPSDRRAERATEALDRFRRRGEHEIVERARRHEQHALPVLPSCTYAAVGKVEADCASGIERGDRHRRDFKVIRGAQIGCQIRHPPISVQPPSTPLKLVIPVLLALAVLAAPGLARAADGPPIELASPPDGGAAWARACSFRHPACVHGSPGTGAPAILATLAAVDRAWDTLTGALQTPPPAADADGRWHVYLVDGVEGGSATRPSSRDPVGLVDRVSSFALVDRALRPGCSLDRAVARAVARGALWAEAPATDAGTGLAESEMLARLATACPGGDDDDWVFQAEPERTLVDPSSASFDRGASRFFEWLDATFGSRPGALVVGTWALAPTTTPPAALRWSGAPNGFDVLGVSLKGALGTDSTLDEVFAAFAVQRGLAFPPVRLAWNVPWPSRGRRFASPIPVSPTGASYVLVGVRGAPPGAKLRVEATWEDFGRMRWSVVKLDAMGRRLADVTVTSLRLGTSASMTIEPLDGVDRVLVVGVDVGSTEHPFDPAQGWWEPHGWLLTVEGE